MDWKRSTGRAAGQLPRIATPIALSALLCACGGTAGGRAGDHSPPEVVLPDYYANADGSSRGFFRLMGIEGLEYSTPSLQGLTSRSGGFSYNAGESVSFFVGGVALGSAAAVANVTPLELDGADGTASASIVNRVRFLMMLDEDNDVGNGIQISPAVREAAAKWTTPDFAADSFDADVAGLVEEAGAADGRTHALPDAATAQAHLDRTLRCVYAGAYVGGFVGDESGVFGLLAHAQSGSVDGAAYRPRYRVHTSLTGASPIDLDAGNVFLTGSGSEGLWFAGRFGTPDAVMGDWEGAYDGLAGTFAGVRIGGDPEAIYRYAVHFWGGDEGVLSLDLDAASRVTGYSYSLAADRLGAVTGTQDGYAFLAVTDDGKELRATFDPDSGRIEGSWTQSRTGLSGSFTGSGCRLN